MNLYKIHTVYKFVLYNLYNSCMDLFVLIRTKTTSCTNLYYTICIKFVQYKKLYPGGDFNRGPILCLQSLLCLPSITPPPPTVAILFIYRTRIGYI